MAKKYTIDPENARRHPAGNQAMIRASLQELGAGRSILVGAGGRVLAGNATYEAAEEAGLEIVEIRTKPNQLVAVVREDLDGRAAVRMGLLDNQASDSSEFDPEALLNLAEKYGEETVTQGIFDPGAWAELTEAAGIEIKPGDNAIGRPPTVPKAKQIKPVLAAEDVAKFEGALRLTGQPNRAQALITICEEFIKNHGGATTES